LMDSVELLRGRSMRFYDYARIAFDNGDYDITVFMCERQHSSQDAGVHT
jgi:HEPN domain-containing protein